MEGRSAVWLLAALLLEALISAQDQNSDQYFEVGGKLVLTPKPGLFSGTIRSISWKLNGSLVAVLDEGQELIYNPVFGGRAKVDNTTGVLEINNTMENDSGVYTVAINDRIQSGGYDVRVITQVPKNSLMYNDRIQYEGYDVRVITQVPKNSLKYLEVGGTLVLTPEPISGRIIGVTWRFNDDIVGEWDEGQELEYSPVFGGRAKVDTATGVLEIRNMMKNDSGVYTVAINNRKQSGGHDVRVIKRVPEPDLW